MQSFLYFLTTKQVKLIQQLDEKDRSTVLNIIDTMLTKRKFKEFFKKSSGVVNTQIFLNNI